MLPQQYCLRWKYHHSNLQTMFSQLLDRGCFCDVTLACDGQMIRAHRVVLCACSTFFDTILTNYSSERDPIIIMKDVTFADVKCLIEFMYKGEINVEHANLASLLKTADDLKIKGLAEVSWREDEEGPPPPVPTTEYYSPKHRMLEAYAQEQLRSSPANDERSITRGMDEVEREEVIRANERRKSLSPDVSATVAASAAKPQIRMPTLTPIPSAVANNVATASSSSGGAEHYLGPKRKRGRPPLDDAYDVFNVRKLAQYAAHMDHQAYLESRHYAEEQRQQHANVINNISPSAATSAMAAAAAAAAYQQHIHHQQSKQRQRHRQQQQQNQQQQHQQEYEDGDHDEDGGTTEPAEWINSNLEVNVGESDGHMVGAAAADNVSDTETELREQKAEIEERVQHSLRKHEKRQHRELSPAEQQQHRLKMTRKNSNERPPRKNSKEELQEQQQNLQRERSTERSAAENATIRDGDEEEESMTKIPKPVDVDVETNVKQQQQMLEKSSVATAETATNLSTTASNSSNTPTTSSSSSSPSSATSNGSCSTSNSIANKAHHIHSTSAAAPPTSHTLHTSQTPPPPLPPPLHHPHFGKYTAPEGYLLNEHGILMTHDFVHAASNAHAAMNASNSAAANATASTTTSSNGATNDQDYMDIKMEDYDAADLRLTTEEMSQWQDVIKMDDYLAKGRRPQFWEEPFTRRVLDAIKNKRLEMKKASRILGVSYGTLYGRYREVYGCLKHPYSSGTFRSSASQSAASQLAAAAAVQPRFDLVWPSPKRDGNSNTLLPTQLEIGKLRPKDLSELWARPQI